MSTTEHDPSGLSITLLKPVTIGGSTYTEVTLREPMVMDLRILSGKAAMNDPITASNQLYATLTDGQIPHEAFDRMSVRDMKKITAWFRPFMDEETS